MSLTEKPSLGRALLLGAAQALSLAPATLGMFGARLLRGWLVAAGLAAVSLGLPGAGGWALGGLGAVVLVCAAVLRSALLAGALEQGRARMLGEPLPALGEGLGRGFSRGLGWWWVGGALELFGAAWTQLALVSAGTAWGLSLVNGRLGIPSSAALAAALSLGLAVSWGASLWVDLALARATAEHTGFSLGLFHSAPGVEGRWLAAAAVALVFNLAGGALELALSVPLSLVSGGAGLGSQGTSSLLLGQLGSGFAAAVAWSVVDHARAQALLALQLDVPATSRSGPPPTAYVVPVAEIIPVAEVLPPPAGGAGGA